MKDTQKKEIKLLQLILKGMKKFTEHSSTEVDEVDLKTIEQKIQKS